MQHRPADRGQLTVFGHDHRTREARRLIGLAEQEINVDRFLSVRQLLIYHAGYHGIGRKAAVRRADDLLAFSASTHKADGRATNCPVACNADSSSPAP